MGEAYATYSRGKNVDDGAVVRVAGAGISGSGGADGTDGGLGGGRRVSGILVVVSGSDGQEDTGVDHGLGGAVDRGRSTTTEGHVGDRAGRARSGLDIGGDEVHASNDAGGSTRTA